MTGGAVHLLLASRSPRRRELLTQIGVRFDLVDVAVEETALAGEPPDALAIRLACAKAAAGVGGGTLPVLGADTVVSVDGEALGKPADRQDALIMLARLSGRSHLVHTAVALADGERTGWRLSSSAVTFRVLQPAEIAAYWETGEPCDKAGGYAIQGLAGAFVTRLEGSYSGVVGLPLWETTDLMQEFGVDWMSGHHPEFPGNKAL